MDTKRLEFTLWGNVQGVLLRDFVKGKAKDLELVGFVENRSDGTVRIVAEGETGKLDTLIDRVRARTENGQKIEDDTVNFVSATGEFEEFKIKK